MLRAAQKRGYRTLGMLVAALKAKGYETASPSLLSQVVRGPKKMPPDLGKLLKELTGWEP